MSQRCKGLTRPNNIYFKMTGLVRRFSWRRNMSSSRTHCCYIIIGTEFKGKYILEQDELFCYAIISSGLKEKTNKQTNVCPFILLANSRPLSPWRLLDFLSTCLGDDSLTSLAHSQLIGLDKVVILVISLLSFLWLWFSFCLPSDGLEACASFLMGGTGCGGNWVLFW